MNALYTAVDYPQAAALNRQVIMAFEREGHAADLRRSHYFHGRFENIHLPIARVPSLSPLLDFAVRAAGALLGGAAPGLRIGFWFNLMRPGDITTLHTHDEDDELLSAVYYLSAPPDCGDLILHSPTGPVRIVPRAGRLVLFAPTLPHEVGRNRSAQARLSIGMNLGPA